MRPVRFLGDSLQCLREFPEDARHHAGYQLDKVQRGEQPEDFKPMAGQRRMPRDSRSLARGGRICAAGVPCAARS
jgi:phage-related protein